MVAIDRVIAPHAYAVSSVVTAIVAGWFTLVFALTMGGLIAGA